MIGLPKELYPARWGLAEDAAAWCSDARAEGSPRGSRHLIGSGRLRSLLQIHRRGGDEDRLPHHDRGQQFWLRLIAGARASGDGRCRCGRRVHHLSDRLQCLPESREQLRNDHNRVMTTKSPGCCDARGLTAGHLWPSAHGCSTTCSMRYGCMLAICRHQGRGGTVIRAHLLPELCCHVSLAATYEEFVSSNLPPVG